MASLRHWTPVFEDVKMEHTTVSSTVLSLLPTSLQSRLPPLRSVQKSVSMQTCQTSVTNRTSSQEPVTPTPTPRGSPKKQSRIADSPSRMSCASTLLDDEALESSPPSPPSGVHWRYALQGMFLIVARPSFHPPLTRTHNGTGLSLLSVAQDEARQPLPSAEFERKAFLDGAEYILKGLPADLSPLELDRLRTSAPRALVPGPQGCNSPLSSTRCHSPCGHAAASSSSSPARSRKSLLHRWVQAAVVQMFVLAHLALPYVVLLARLAARAEREYNISHNVASAGWGLVHSIGAQGVKATGTLCGIGDGRVGQAIAEAVAWTVEGVSGGLSEGVGQGMVIMSASRP
ncbi:hypothetical protein D7B24_005687 [Verticillium nonalfalfae]|uniref:Uncharacterized protein n=1 Tax=Verticillium nonalfalfae TaxID=1051616 RepID=A0A3M9XUG1_9PEZI|nr:uncharacterized protein D7B24_005687 [Verticillium nonalfalfae]RNJ51927.1 hypothetical protein D7B24_005687 [Verticillium nonalfalfae]